MENVDNLFTKKPDAYSPPEMDDSTDGASEVKPGDDGYVAPQRGNPASQQAQDNQNFNKDELEEHDNDYSYSDDEQENTSSQEAELDDYGNEQKKPKMYTEEEAREMANRAVRERVARFEKNNPQTHQEAQYPQDNDQDWEVQLENLLDKTLEKREARRIQQEQMNREYQANVELESKIHAGMQRFNDFVEVVGAQPITDHMVKSVRGLKDPAAFLYAASKHNAQELKRISELPDPFAQAREMGKLEERMRKTSKTSSRAPRPLGKTMDDGSGKSMVEREPSIDQRINEFAQKRAPQRR